MATLTDLSRRVRARRRIHLPSRRLRIAKTSPVAGREAATRLFLPSGYEARHQSDYHDDRPDGEIEYQPGVYARAARIGRHRGARTIIDVGCGHARKLAALHPRFRLVGIDIGPNIEFCRERYRFGEWIEHDLETSAALPLEAEQLSGAVIVCADVIEHLVDPEPALRNLKAASDRADALLISTPDRDRVPDQPPLGPPANRNHAREWSRRELATLLRWCGFEDGHLTHTRSQTRSLSFETLLYVRDGSSVA